MYLETLGVDIDTNDPTFSEDADYQGVWNPVVIARHIIQHRRTPIYNAYAFPPASKVLRPGDWDWLERKSKHSRANMSIKSGSPWPKRRRVRRQQATANAVTNIDAAATAAINKALSGDLDTLGGFGSWKRRLKRGARFGLNPMAQARFIKNHANLAYNPAAQARFARSGLRGDDLLLGGWGSRLKRKARKLAHTAISVGTMIPGVSGIANAARAAGTAADALSSGKLPSLADMASGISIPGVGNLSNLQNIAGALAPSLPGMGGPGPGDAANQILQMNNALPADTRQTYGASALTLPSLDLAARSLVVPDRLPAQHIVREIEPTRIGVKKSYKAWYIGAGVLALLAGASAFAYTKHRRSVATPAIGTVA